MTTAALQALATGLPTITTDHGAFFEQVIDGKDGFLIKEGDYQDLAEKILYMMDHAELWPSLGSFGREHVRKNFDSKSMLDKQVKLYEDILMP